MRIVYKTETIDLLPGFIMTYCTGYFQIINNLHGVEEKPYIIFPCTKEQAIKINHEINKNLLDLNEIGENSFSDIEEFLIDKGNSE